MLNLSSAVNPALAQARSKPPTDLDQQADKVAAAGEDSKPGAELHNQLQKNPEQRDAVYHHLARTDPGLIHHLEQLRGDDAPPAASGDKEAPGPGEKKPAPGGDPHQWLKDLLPPQALQVLREVTEASQATEPVNPAVQAKTDAQAVQAAYDKTLQRTGNAAQAAAAAAEQLKNLTKAHAGDTVYTTTLLREAQGTLDQIGQVLGRHANGEFRGSEADRQAIQNTVFSLNKAAELGGALGAQLIAMPIAKHIPNKSELHKIDDAFYDVLKNGGSPLLFQALYQNLKALGKDKAAQELKVDHGNVWASIDEHIDGILDTAGNIFSSVGDGLIKVVTGAGELLVDVAKGTVDVVEDTVEALQDGLEFAVKNGLKLGAKLLDYAIGLVRSGLDSALGLDEKIKGLGVGDSYELALDVEVALELGIEVGRGITVERAEDGSYAVSGWFSANVDIKHVAGAKVGAGGKVTFTANSPEEAKQLALMLATGPKTSEFGFAREHLTSIEVSGSAALEGELAKLGIGEVHSELSGEVGVERSFRIEFDNGQPVALVVGTTLYGQGTAAGDARTDPKLAALRELASRLGFKLPANLAAQGEFEITMETRIPLNGIRAGVGELVDGGDLVDAVRKGAADAKTTIHLQADLATGSTGHTEGKRISLDITGLDLNDAAAVAKFLVTGDAKQLKGVPLKVEGWIADFEYDDHSPLDLNLIISGVNVGIAINTQSSTTDVDYEHRKPIVS